MRSNWLLVVAIGCLAFGCSSGGGGEDLSINTVAHLPDGTGSGTAASGVYAVQLDVTACTGACTAPVGGITVSLCTVGPVGTTPMTVTQSGGHLSVHNDSANIIVHDLSGGINADGTFDVGGVATAVDGQSLTVTTRVQGSISGNTATATAESQGNGVVNGSTIDCVQTLQMTGSR